MVLISRQDRYIVIEDCAPLATFCEELVRKISQFSLHLKKDGSFQVCQEWKGGHPVEGDYAKYKSAVKQSLMQFIEDYKVKHKLKGNFTLFLIKKKMRTLIECEH